MIWCIKVVMQIFDPSGLKSANMDIFRIELMRQAQLFVFCCTHILFFVGGLCLMLFEKEMT